MDKLNEVILHINKKIEDNDGKLYFVGGFVRDHLLGVQNKDYDFEVFKISDNLLHEILCGFGEVRYHHAFGVYTLYYEGSSYEFSIPRIELKDGVRYNEFKIDLQPNLTLEEASIRRDFKMNALYYDISTGEIIDSQNGIMDINNRVISHISTRFSEDPLRVLRALRFAAKLGFKIEDDTLKLCEQLVYQLKYIANERKNNEFYEIMSGEYLVSSLNYIRQILFKYFNVLISQEYDLCSINTFLQNPYYHPEGDVWTHTYQTLEVAQILGTELDEESRFITNTALLLHDIGKVKDTYVIDERIRNTGHEYTSYVFAKKILSEFVIKKKLRKRILNLIRFHMIPYELDNMKSTSLVSYFQKFGDDILLLIFVSLCDKSGRLNKDIDSTFNDKIAYNRKIMYDRWVLYYENYKELKKKYDGNYYLNIGISGKDIASRQLSDISCELDKIKKNS